MSDAPQVFAAFLAVQADLEAVTKNRRVTEGPARFAFRGVDDVMNALHGPLSAHGLIIVPQVLERLAETRTTSKGGTMNVVHLRVRFAFYAADGSSFYAEAWGEGQDSGDKATGKAHSMAYKSALLEAFHVPTEDVPDADTDTTPAAPQRPAQAPQQPPPWQARWRNAWLALTDAQKSAAIVWMGEQGWPASPVALSEEQANAVSQWLVDNAPFS